MRRFLTLCGLAVALALAVPTAKAGFVPVLTSPAPGGSANAFIYSLNFTSNGSTETLVSGDFVTLYDFDAGVTSAAQIVVPAGITASVQAVGLTPPGGLVNPTDNAGINNITFTYTGATLTTDTSFSVTVNTAGGPYTTRVGQYTSTDSITTGKNQQIGPVLVPTAVPEPSSLALAGRHHGQRAEHRHHPARRPGQPDRQPGHQQHHLHLHRRDADARHDLRGHRQYRRRAVHHPDRPVHLDRHDLDR